VNAQGQLIKIPPARVGLSTTSVYPESTSSAFELARRLGYDGVEIMVGIDPVAADIDAVEKLRDYHEVPVLAIHSPCLLITQRVWGTDPWAKLERSAEAALRLDADVVVVHPPFRWQRDYARGFVEGVRRLAEATGILFCVENMYPWRTPGGELKAYVPGWDPTDLDYADLTLDLSHASTAGQQSIDLVRSWGSRLRHVHLTDGTGSVKDEHLVPGRGDQRAGECCSTSLSGILPGTSSWRSIRARVAPAHSGKPTSPSRWPLRGYTWQRPSIPHTPWTQPGLPARSELRRRTRRAGVRLKGHPANCQLRRTPSRPDHGAQSSRGRARVAWRPTQRAAPPRPRCRPRPGRCGPALRSSGRRSQPLEKELSAGAGRWVELAGELLAGACLPSPASRLLPERDLLIMKF
jgi:sugar phosphate isomerase/epimerase